MINGTPVERGTPVSFDVDVRFNNWGTNITNMGVINSQLNDMANALKGNSNLHIWISGMGMSAGNTTSPTNSNYTANMNNFDRARALRQQLLNRGVDINQMTIGRPIPNAGRRGAQITARTVTR